ncbi:MAG TPA: 6-bladed beta-propeller [Phocaeicola coprophilus]|nr:6-bladed beta-propeller [Phocaeicola coprophilus]
MYSCSSGEKHPDVIEDIFVSLEDKSLTIDKPAFETFDYVKLEMTSESVIGDVSKVVIGNERIYVLSLIDPRIFIFSLDGKYINSLKRGNGPGEVLFVSDFEYRNNNLCS